VRLTESTISSDVPGKEGAEPTRSHPGDVSAQAYAKEPLTHRLNKVGTTPFTHERPYLVIAATPMQLLMKSPDGASMEHPIKAGDLHWVESKVTHVRTNRGTEAGVIVEVELK